MRFFSSILALAAIPLVLAIPAGTGSIDLSSSLDARDYSNSTLEARTGGRGGGKDHCKKEFGRGSDCGCYAGLSCHNDYDKCECGDQKNSFFEFKGRNDEPKCLCSGDDQHYNKREKKCFCDASPLPPLPCGTDQQDGFAATYKHGGILVCKLECGKNQHYVKREKECVCDDGFKSSTKNGQLVCKKPECGQHQHFDRGQNKCVCDDKFDASEKNGQLVCTPCKPPVVCGEHQKFDKHQDKCVCKPGFNASKKHGVLVCTPCAPTASKNYHPRALETGAPAPIEFNTVEEALGCSAAQTACKIGSSWTCFDASSNLASCGGCPGEGVDCSSIEGVDEVRCAKGQCVIDSCQRGFTATGGVCVARGLLLQ